MMHKAWDGTVKEEGEALTGYNLGNGPEKKDQDKFTTDNSNVASPRPSIKTKDW